MIMILKKVKILNNRNNLNVMNQEICHIKLSMGYNKISNSQEKWGDVNSIPYFRDNIIPQHVLNNTHIKNTRTSVGDMGRLSNAPKN